MRLGFEESVAIVADFLYPGQPQVQQIIFPDIGSSGPCPLEQVFTSGFLSRNIVRRGKTWWQWRRYRGGDTRFLSLERVPHAPRCPWGGVFP
jgi:hypothetical protein